MMTPIWEVMLWCELSNFLIWISRNNKFSSALGIKLGNLFSIHEELDLATQIRNQFILENKLYFSTSLIAAVLQNTDYGNSKLAAKCLFC